MFLYRKKTKFVLEKINVKYCTQVVTNTCEHWKALWGRPWKRNSVLSRNSPAILKGE